MIHDIKLNALNISDHRIYKTFPSFFNNCDNLTERFCATTLRPIISQHDVVIAAD